MTFSLSAPREGVLAAPPLPLDMLRESWPGVAEAGVEGTDTILLFVGVAMGVAEVAALALRTAAMAGDTVTATLLLLRLLAAGLGVGTFTITAVFFTGVTAGGGTEEVPEDGTGELA